MTTKTSISALLALFLVVAAPPAFAQVCTPAQPCGDIDDSQDVTVIDALSVLRRSIGLSVDLTCSCDGGGECPLGGVTETEQVQCWDRTDTLIPIKPIDCVGTGQDGEFRSGLPTDFVDNGDGTITDRRTTLTWEKLDTVENPDHDPVTVKYLWPGAFQKIHDLNASAFAGYDDWRLPQVRELATLVDFASGVTSVPLAAVAPPFDFQCRGDGEPCEVEHCRCTLPSGLDCSCTLPAGYWTSTTNQEGPDKAWVVDFGTGLVDPNAKKTEYHYVRAVRGGY